MSPISCTQFACWFGALNCPGIRTSAFSLNVTITIKNYTSELKIYFNVIEEIQFQRVSHGFRIGKQIESFEKISSVKSIKKQAATDT